ncbi:hypothetical protein tb265_13660 [Gemmatimonadetes bacterium T265]|nr:hypothetical protein tb265_13660 [Gemmatimonadetes bacterium T265]
MSASTDDLPHAVLFDFGGTLDADGLPSVAQFDLAYRAEGGTRDPGAFADAFRTSDWQLASLAHVAGLAFTATVDAQIALLAALLPGESHVDWRAVAARVTAAAHAVAARNRPLLQSLHAHARLGVVSNFTGNVDRCLDELGLLDLFDAIADSAVVGHAKPDPELFRTALRALDTPPANAMMVGDNPFADVRPAAALGMRTCWLAPLQRPAPDGCTPTHRIARLPDLLAVLGVDPRVRGDDGRGRSHPRASANPPLVR